MNFLLLFWSLLAGLNFFAQVAYFRRDQNRGLFLFKKVTTPLLLFLGAFLHIHQSSETSLVSIILLTAMGIGELGIEGSSVVEEKGRESQAVKIRTLLAGVLFLLVNLFLGGVLLSGETRLSSLFLSGGAALMVIGAMLFLALRILRPGKEITTQMVLYSIGLVVLCAGAFSDLLGGITNLGRAAWILTVSDSLVLIRMGASWQKKVKKQRRLLAVFLVVILLLYYTYMGLLIFG